MTERQSPPHEDKKKSSGAADFSQLKLSDDQRARPRRSWGRWVALLALVLMVFVSRRLWWPLIDGFWLPRVQVATARMESPGGTPSGSLTANGYVVAQRQAALAAKMTGRLQELLVVEGSVVEKGEVVGVLEHEDLKAQRLRAEADLRLAQASVSQSEAEVNRLGALLRESRLLIEAARASREEIEALFQDAEREFERQKKLIEDRMTSESAFETAKAQWISLQARHRESELREESSAIRVEAIDAQLDAARFSVESAKAQVEARQADRQLLDVQLDYVTIKAPFSGVVIRKDAEVGEIVAPISGGALAKVAVVTIVDMDSLMVEADVNEAYISRIYPDQKARVRIDAVPDRTYEAHVFKIVPAADRQKATVEVKIAFDDPDERILPEMGATLFFIEDDEEQEEATPSESYLSIPQSAVVDGTHGESVWVLKDGAVERRTVRLGRERDGRVEVQSGLVRGELVVVSDPDSLEDGMKVRPDESSSPQ